MSGNKTIGILGGGQLARMSAFAAKRLGFDIAILEKEKNSPAGQLTHLEFVGSIDDDSLLTKFAEKSDIITLENEFVDADRLAFIEKLGKKVIPSSNTIRLIQDKLIQKNTFKKNGIPVPRFIEVTDESKYAETVLKLSHPFLLKSRKMGYDGYGNALIQSEKDFRNAVESLSKRHSALMAESFVKFSMELAVMVVRTRKEIRVYPVVQTIQENHICKIVIAPARISKKTKEAAIEMAVEAVKSVKGYGIFGVELFLTNENQLLVNEMAPRPHNSGHYSIDACITSQFENHIRSVLNLPLGNTDMINSYAVMVNLLGKQTGPGFIQNYDFVLSSDSVHLHLYGKEKSRKGRKMGHFTLTGNNLDSIFQIAKQIETKIII